MTGIVNDNTGRGGSNFNLDKLEQRNEQLSNSSHSRTKSERTNTLTVSCTSRTETDERERVEWMKNEYYGIQIKAGCNILQWNIRGVRANSAALMNVARIYDYKVMLLQEMSTKYDKNWIQMHLDGHELESDENGKTGIYIQEGIQYMKLKLKMIDETPPNGIRRSENRLYATACVVTINIKGKQQNIALLSLYRSGNGCAKEQNYKWMDYRRRSK